MALVKLPTRLVRADSVFTISTWLPNGADIIDKPDGLVNRRTKEYVTDLQATVWAEVRDNLNTVTLAQTQLPFVSAGRFETDAPAQTCISGAGPWLVNGWVYGPAGVLDTQLARFRYLVTEDDDP